MSGWTVFKLFVLLVVFVVAMGVDAYWLSTVQPEYVAKQAVDQFRDGGQAMTNLRQYDIAKGCLTATVVTLAAGLVMFAGDICRVVGKAFKE